MSLVAAGRCKHHQAAQRPCSTQGGPAPALPCGCVSHEMQQPLTGLCFMQPTQRPPVRMTAAAVARAAAGAERRASLDVASRPATKVCSPPLCCAVLLRPVLPTVNEDSCSTGYHTWMLPCRPQAATTPLHQVASLGSSRVQALLQAKPARAPSPPRRSWPRGEQRSACTPAALPDGAASAARICATIKHQAGLVASLLNSRGTAGCFLSAAGSCSSRHLSANELRSMAQQGCLPHGVPQHA